MTMTDIELLKAHNTMLIERLNEISAMPCSAKFEQDCQSCQASLVITSLEEWIAMKRKNEKNNFTNPVYDMNQQKFVELRPYMDWVSHIDTSKVTDDQWEESLKLSITDSEYEMILKGRSRNHG